METKMANWLIEFLIQKCVDDSVLNCLLSSLPLNGIDFRIKKLLLLRRIQGEVSRGLITPTILNLLELIRELDHTEGKISSESMREAYCAVAVDCTVKHLELNDYEMYGESVQKIWRRRIRKMDDSGLVDEKTRAWMDDIEAASSNVEIRGKLMSINTRYEAVKAVKCYLAEAYKEIGPSFIEKTAKDVVRKGKTRKGYDEILEEKRFEGLEDIGEAHKSPSRPCEKPSVDEIGEEQGLIENVNGVAPSGHCEKLSEDNVHEIPEEQGLEGLGNLNETHNGVAPSGPCEKLSEDEIMEECSENVNKAFNDMTPSGPCRKRSFDEIEEEQGVLKNVNEDHNRVTPSVTCQKPSADEIKGLKNVNEAHNRVTPTGPCEKPSPDEIMEDQGFEGPENLNKDRNDVTPSGPCQKPSADEIMEEQGFEGPKNLNKASNDVTPSGPCQKPSADEIMEEEGFDGSKNLNKAQNDVTPSGPCHKPSFETPHKQLSKRRKTLGVRKIVPSRTGTKAKLSNTEDLDKDTEMKKYPYLPTPEYNKTKADLESSFADLGKSVKDPLPEALKFAEQVSLDLNKDANAEGSRGGELNVESTDRVNQSLTNDPFEFDEGSLPNRVHLRNPLRTVSISPLKNSKGGRRQPRKWSVVEEDTLRKGVNKFGRGNWKIILNEYRDVFEERTEVDLKDKWRNMTR